MHKRAIFLLAFLSSTLLALAGCGGGGGDEEPFGVCPENSLAQQMTGAMLIASRCQICHSVAVTGAARNGATPGIDFDTAADVDKNADRVFARAVQQGTMPPAFQPGMPLDATEKEAVRAYLACDSMLEPAP